MKNLFCIGAWWTIFWTVICTSNTAIGPYWLSFAMPPMGMFIAYFYGRRDGVEENQEIWMDK